MNKLRAVCVALALCAGVASAAPKKIHPVSPAKARKNAEKAQAKARKNAAKSMAKAHKSPAKVRKHKA